MIILIIDIKELMKLLKLVIESAANIIGILMQLDYIGQSSHPQY